MGKLKARAIGYEYEVIQWNLEKGGRGVGVWVSPW